VLKEVESARAHQLNRNGKLRIAPNHYDGERKLPTIDLVDQRPQSDAGEIKGHKDAPGSGCSDLIKEFRGAVVSPYDDRFPGEGVHDAAGLIGKRIDDEYGFGVCGFDHGPRFAPATMVGPPDDRYVGPRAFSDYVESEKALVIL
jgi:hypothetical protein